MVDTPYSTQLSTPLNPDRPASKLPAAYAALDLTGTVGIVTGATSGMGKETAELAALRGAKVVLAARREDEANKIVDKIKRLGGEAHFVKTDVSVESDVKHLVAETVRVYGRLDWAFNNAGVFFQSHKQPANPEEFSEEDFDKEIAINLKGVHYCMKYQLQQFLKQWEAAGGSTLSSQLSEQAKQNPNDLHKQISGQFSIINNSSVAGLQAGKNNYAYSATKHAVIGMTKSASELYSNRGVRVNAICPGFIWSEMTGGFDPTRMINSAPMERVGQVDEIAQLVCFLASRASTFITGVPLVIDGGFMESNSQKS